MKNLLSISFLLTLLVCFLFPNRTYAKYGKVKFGTYLIYEGNVDNNLPYKEGKLKLVSPTYKENTDYRISGIFSNEDPKENLTFNAQIIEIYYQNSSFYLCGDMTFKCNGGLKKCNDMEIAITNSKISYYEKSIHSDECLKALNFTLNFQLSDPKWCFTITDHSEIFNVKTLLANDKIASTSFGRFLKSLDGNGYFMAELPLGVHYFYGYKNNTVKRIGKCTFTFERGSEPHVLESVYIINDNLFFYDNTFYDLEHNTTYSIHNYSWSGERFLSDGTYISKKEDSEIVNIKFPNGNKYVGTLKDGNKLALIENDAVVSPKTFYNGEYTNNGVKEKWVKGELIARLSKIPNKNLKAQNESTYDKLKAECTFLKQEKEYEFEALCANDMLKYFGKNELDDLDMAIYKKSAVYQEDLAHFERIKKEQKKFAVCFEAIGYMERFEIQSDGFKFYHSESYNFDAPSVMKHHVLYGNYAIPVIGNCVQDVDVPWTWGRCQRLHFACTDLSMLKYIKDNSKVIDLVFVIKPSMYRKENLFIGSTIGIYLFNSVTGELVLDLSKYGRNIDSQAAKQKENSYFNSDRAYRAAKRDKAAAREKAKKYHSVPKRIACFPCASQGVVYYIEGSVRKSRRCSFCYGKGYTLEHYY